LVHPRNAPWLRRSHHWQILAYRDPNWTGRLPISGEALMALAAL